VGRAIRRRQAGGWIGDEQPGKEHDCGNRKEPKRTAGEVLTNDANGSAGRDANEEQRNAAEEIWGRRYARRSRRWVARRCAVQHERSNVRLQARVACAASLCKPLLGTPRASKKPAHQKKKQRRREDRDVCIHAQNGWDSALVAQRATIEGDCEGAEPEATKDA
jgi:hypothetical protein